MPASERENGVGDCGTIDCARESAAPVLRA